MSHRQSTTIRIGLGLLVVAVLVVYGRLVFYDAIPSWDDGLYLFQRPEVRDWWGATWRQRLLTPELGYALPVPTVVYAHLRLLGGELYPHLVHGLQVVLHLGNVLLVFGLVQRWHDEAIALAVATLWGLHPIDVETVAWLTNLKTVGATSSLLGSMLIWERFLQSAEASEPPPWHVWLPIALLFMLGLGSRPDAAILPLLLALQTVRSRGWRAPPIEIGALLGGLLAVGVVYVPFADGAHDQVVHRSAVAEGGLSNHVVRIFRALEISCRNFLVPIDLHPGYFLPGDPTWLDALPGAAIACSLAALTVVLARQHDWSLLFAIGVAALCYAPFSNIVFLPRLTADTYLYMPGIGTTLALVLGATRLASRLGEPLPRLQRAHVVAVVIVAVLLAGATFRQTGRWQNARTLWEPVVREQPRVPRSYRIVGWYYAQQQQWEQSAEILEAGLPMFRRNRSYPFFLPEVLEQIGEPERAAELALEALNREAHPRPVHEKVLLEVLARNDLPLPESPDVRELVGRALETYVERDDWMADRDNRLAIADYATRYPPLASFAVPLLAREFRISHPHCFAWKALKRLPTEARASLPSRPLPDRCRP